MPPTPAEHVRSDLAFAIVPLWLVRTADARPIDVRVYADLAGYVGADQTAWPGRKRLADDIGVSVDTIDRSLRTLEEIGAVTKQSRHSKQGHPISNLYTVHRITEEMARKIAAEERPYSRGGAATKKNQTRRTTTPPTGSPPDVLWQEVARLWCEIAGITPTRSVMRQMGPKIREFIDAHGAAPSEDFMVQAHSQGIKGPGGWPYVRPERRHVYDRPEQEDTLPTVQWDDIDLDDLPEQFRAVAQRAKERHGSD